MTLIERVSSDMTAAMKARDASRLSALRMLKAAIVNKGVEKGRDLDDADAQQVVSSLVKQRRDVFNKDGGLDTINENVARSNIRLIRRSKSPQKTAHPVDNKEISVDSGNLCPSPG